MMFASSCHDIDNLRLTQKEADSRNRNRLGLHVFLSRFFYDFCQLSDEEKWKRLVGVRRSKNAPNAEDIDTESVLSFDSTDTPPDIKVWQVMQLAFSHWRKLPVAAIQSWKKRARWLNGMPLAGRFVRVPASISHGGTLQTNVCQSLTCDWERTVRILRNSVMRKPKRLLSSKVVFFRKEEVKLLSQTFRSMYMSLLLRRTLFGLKNDRLLKGEMVYQSKKVVIIHFSSLERLKEIFTVAGLCGMEFLNVATCHRHFACGKVSVKRNGRNMVGYVLEESRRLWTVLLWNNEKVKLRRPMYRDGVYLYANCGRDDRLVITYFWPVRFMIRCSGECKFTLNRVAIDSPTGEIVSQHSS